MTKKNSSKQKKPENTEKIQWVPILIASLVLVFFFVGCTQSNPPQEPAYTPPEQQPYNPPAQNPPPEQPPYNPPSSTPSPTPPAPSPPPYNPPY